MRRWSDVSGSVALVASTVAVDNNVTLAICDSGGLIFEVNNRSDLTQIFHCLADSIVWYNMVNPHTLAEPVRH